MIIYLKKIFNLNSNNKLKKFTDTYFNDNDSLNLKCIYCKTISPTCLQC